MLRVEFIIICFLSFLFVSFAYGFFFFTGVRWLGGAWRIAQKFVSVCTERECTGDRFV